MYKVLQHMKYLVLFRAVFSKMSVAVEKIPDASVLVNFASLRSAYDATVDALQYSQVPGFTCS